MRSTLRIFALAALIGYMAPTPAMALADDDAKLQKGKNPNETICESSPELGSRLVRHRVCMTRAQWAERRQADRQIVEHSQLQSCTRQAGC